MIRAGQRFCQILLSLSLCFGVVGCTASPARAVEQSWSSAFDQQVQEWIKQLREKDPTFAGWQDTKRHVQSLGPGQHQWLVTLSKKNRPVGYLIIAEQPDTAADGQHQPLFSLLEYGVGEYRLFDPALAPAKEAVPVYDGLASHWQAHDEQGSIEIRDAMTGEIYPRDTANASLQMGSLAADEMVTLAASLDHVQHIRSEPEEPFARIDWLQSGRSLGMDQVLNQTADSRSLILYAHLYDERVDAAYSIGAIHQWDQNIAYIGVWDEGLRFLPYSYLSRIGNVIQ